MKIKVYHVETDEYMRIISPFIIPHGYIEADTFNAEQCWHLCNWDCWADKKPKELHSDIKVCNHGLIVYNPETKEYWLAITGGWIRGNGETIIKWLSDHWKDCIWLDKEKEVVLRKETQR